jgi:hypothetical protein
MPGKPWEKYAAGSTGSATATGPAPAATGPWAKYQQNTVAAPSKPPAPQEEESLAHKIGTSLGTFAGTAVNDLKGFLRPQAQNPYPGMGQEQKAADAAIADQQDKNRKAAGYSMPYRVLAPVAQSVGTNVPGMEQSAAEGDTAGVLGHTLAAVTPQAVSLGTNLMRRPTPPPGMEGIPETAGGGFRGKVQTYMGLGDRMVKEVGTKTLTDHAAEVAKVNDKNATAQATHADKLATMQQREGLQQTTTQGSAQLIEKVNQLEQNVLKQDKAKFDVVKQKVGNDTAPPEALAKAVEHAQKKIIAGTPENIKQFKDILTQAAKDDEGGGTIMMGGAPVAVDSLPPNIRAQFEAKGLVKPPSAGLGWNYLQGIYTELGRTMYNGTAPLPGDVYNALKYVRNAVGEQMGAMAERNGATADWGAAKAYHQQYMNTFHNMKGVAYSGGSPVARVMRAAAPDYALSQVTGKAGENVVNMLKAYSELDPTAAATAEQVRTAHAQSKTLPQTRVLPKTPVPEPLPVPPDVSEAIKLARTKEIGTTAKNLSRLSGWDLAAGAGAIHELASGQFPYAVGITVLRHGLGAILDKPAVIDWLTTPTPKDFSVLNKVLKPEEIGNVQKAVAQVYAKQAKAGNNLPLDSGTRSFLLPGQVTAILAAQGSAARTQKFSTPESIMLGMKTGEIDPAEGDSMLKKLRGSKGAMLRPLAPPR